LSHNVSHYMQCPKCRGAMRTYTRSGVQIEQCDNCRGIFLDYGELEALTRLETQWSAPPPPPPPAMHQQPAWGHGGHGGHGYGHGHHGHRSFGHMLFSS
jgi:Zn-finger nucleic acid-binding protein